MPALFSLVSAWRQGNAVLLNFTLVFGIGTESDTLFVAAVFLEGRLGPLLGRAKQQTWALGHRSKNGLAEPALYSNEADSPSNNVFTFALLPVCQASITSRPQG
jgi:hypothetical protein